MLEFGPGRKQPHSSLAFGGEEVPKRLRCPLTTQRVTQEWGHQPSCSDLANHATGPLTNPPRGYFQIQGLSLNHLSLPPLVPAFKVTA